MKKLPKISVVTVVRNSEKTLAKAIDSVLTQSYPDLEYIIIDGCSTDKTVEIIKSYESSLAYWHSKKDRGAADAYNIGLSKATGDIVIFLNADDWYEPELFSRLAECYQQNPEADIYTCSGRVVTYKKDKLITTLMYDSSKELNLNLYNICYAVSAFNCRFYRRSLFERVGFLLSNDKDGVNNFSNDKEWLLRVYFSGVKEVFIPYMGHNYLAHPGSDTFGGNITNTKRLLREHIVIADQFMNDRSLSESDKFFIANWKVDQMIRLMFREVMSGCIRQAFVVASQAFKDQPVLFVKSLLTMPFSIIWHRLYRQFTGRVLLS